MVISNLRRLAIEKINVVVKWLIVKSGWGFQKGLSVALSAKVGKWKKIKIKTRDCQFIVSSTSAKPNLLTFPERSPASTPLLPTAGVKVTKVPSQHHCHCFHTQLFCSVRVRRNPRVGHACVLGVPCPMWAHSEQQDWCSSHFEGQPLFHLVGPYWYFKCRTRNQIKIHGNTSHCSVFRCSVIHKYLGRIKIRF